MDHETDKAKDGMSAAHAIELARKARLAQRAAADFLRRWAVEQTVDNVGLVALGCGLIDLPLSVAKAGTVQTASGS